MRVGRVRRRGPVRVPGQGALRALRDPRLRGSAGDDARRSARGRSRSSAARSSSRRRCSRAGAARPAGSSSRTIPTRRAAQGRADPRSRHPRPRRAQALDRARVRHREGVLPLAHVRPRREAAALHVHDGGRHRHRGGRRSRARGARAPARRPARGLPALAGAGGSSTAPGSRTRTSRSRSSRSSGSSTRRSSAPTRCSREINPLIVTPDGEVKALDSKFTVDDDALFRHPDIAEMRDLDAAPPEERAAREKGVTYVKLDGEVGILGNGAGLVMSTLDVIALAGGRPANFCDLGGGGDARGRRRRARGDHRRPAGEVDPLQRLRRDHALRRGRARDPRRRSTG